MANDKFEFKRSPLVIGNSAIFLWSGLATVAIWPTYPLLTWFFFLLALAMVFVILRRLGCNTCAYCKECTSGFGRISSCFFGSRSVKDTRNKTALIFVAAVYGQLGLVPIALLTTSTVQEFTVFKTVLLACIAGFLFYSLTTWLRKPSA